MGNSNSNSSVCSCDAPRQKPDKTKKVLDEFESSIRQSTAEESRRAVMTAFAGGLTRSQLYYAWSSENGRGPASDANLTLVLKCILSQYMELFRESIETVVVIYQNSDRAKLLPPTIAKQIARDMEPAWHQLEAILSKMSEAELARIVKKQVAAFKLEPSQELSFDTFEAKYTRELGPDLALTLLARTDMVPNFFELVKRKYSPIF